MRTSSARAFFFFLLSAESGTHCCHCTASGLPLSAPQWRRSGRTVSRSIPSTEDGEEKKKSVPGPPVEKTITRQAGAFDPPPQPTAKKGEKKTPKIQKKKRKRKIGDGSDSNGLLRWPTDRHTGGGGVLFRNVHVLGPSSVLFFFLPDFTIIFIERLECSEYHTNSERSLSFRSSDGTEIGFFLRRIQS